MSDSEDEAENSERRRDQRDWNEGGDTQSIAQNEGTPLKSLHNKSVHSDLIIVNDYNNLDKVKQETQAQQQTIASSQSQQTQSAQSTQQQAVSQNVNLSDNNTNAIPSQSLESGPQPTITQQPTAQMDTS